MLSLYFTTKLGLTQAGVLCSKIKEKTAILRAVFGIFLY